MSAVLYVKFSEDSQFHCWQDLQAPVKAVGLYSSERSSYSNFPSSFIIDISFSRATEVNLISAEKSLVYNMLYFSTLFKQQQFTMLADQKLFIRSVQTLNLQHTGFGQLMVFSFEIEKTLGQQIFEICNNRTLSFCVDFCINFGKKRRCLRHRILGGFQQNFSSLRMKQIIVWGFFSSNKIIWVIKFPFCRKKLLFAFCTDNFDCSSFNYLLFAFYFENIIFLK